jgi:hypothetical protein
VVAVSCTKNTGGNAAGGGGGSASGNNSGIASANDNGPVGIITEDPSCAPWGPVATTLANATSNGWDNRDPSIPATAWTQDQQAQYQSVAQALRSAADQAVPLVKLTTHRVMRELYEQFIVYSRAYADSVPTYTTADDYLNGASASIVSVVNGICGSITYHAAAARAPLIATPAAPTHVAQPGDPSNPTRFMPTADPQCADWKSAIDQMFSDSAYVAWVKEDTSIPASSWSDQYKAENQAVASVMSRSADTYEKLGRQSSNPFIEDVAVLSAQYGRAFVAALPTYSSSDSYLYNVFVRVPGVIKSACGAVGAY